MKKFSTTIEEIDTMADAAVVFDDFIHSFTKQDLYDEAEAYVKSRAPLGMSVYSFRHMDDGLMGMVMGLIVMNSTNAQICKAGVWLDRKLMEHYEFTSESIPPRMLIREAIATRIRLSSIMADLEREVGGLSRSSSGRAIRALADGCVEPDEAFTLPDADVDRVIR